MTVSDFSLLKEILLKMSYSDRAGRNAEESGAALAHLLLDRHLAVH